MLQAQNPFPRSGSEEPTGAASAASKFVPPDAVEAQGQPPEGPAAFAATPRSEQCPNQEIDCRQCRESLTTAAHDLKTPVSILSGYIELMLSEKLGPLTARQRTALQEMHDNGQRLRGFVNNFLTLSKFRDASVELQIAPADLNACLNETMQVWEPSYQRKGIALFFAPSDQIQQFAFDYYKCQHVVSNLLDNALKFTPAGGTVWLAAELHLWERRSRQGSAPSPFDRRRAYPSLPNTVRVTVADSGPGIAPEFHQEIFQEYFRANHVTEGHGLGLAIAQRLVNRFGGKIWVESEPESGAKFSFLLPLRTPG